MSRSMPAMSLLVLMLALITVSGVAGAVVTLADTTIEDYRPTGYRGGISSHVGELCVACHTRFSKDRAYAEELPYNVSKDAVLHVFPCSKPACHFTPPTKFRPIRFGTNRWDRHLKICDNCHPRWNSSYETIHNTHLNFSYLTLNRSGVECKLCHAHPEGYNSSVVRVPPWPDGEAGAPGKIHKPEWGGDCAYCHFTIKGAQRVHDVHEPVIVKACPICHSPYILKAPKMFARIGVEYPFEEKGPRTVEEKLTTIVATNRSITTPEVGEEPPAEGRGFSVLSEFYLYFDGILEKLLEIYSNVV